MNDNTGATISTAPSPNDPLIFVNYRDQDEPWAATHLAGELVGCFGDGTVFLDSISVPFGTDFRPPLLRAVSRSSLLLAVIGTRWLTAERHGRRMLDDERDWVRAEIALAAATNVHVVPVLIGDARPPSAADLPQDIRSLAYRRFLRVRHRDSQWDVERLIDSLVLIEPRLAALRRDG